VAHGPDGLQDRRAARAARAAQIRRRRLVALGVLFLAVAIVAAVVAIAGSGGDDKTTASTATATRGSRPSTTTSAKPAPAKVPGAHRAPRERVPILMYHVVNRPPAGTAIPELWVSREDFAAQVAALAGRGYHGVTLRQVWDAWHHGGLLPSKPIVFSFDDGYHSQFSNALPVLSQRKWPGVLNLETKLLATDLKPPDVRAMLEAGWEVDAHTIDHPDLTTVDSAQLTSEVAGSRREIRKRFGVPVNFFCYPAGKYDDTVIAAVKAAGFLGATTTELGLASPSQSPYKLSRIRVNGSDGVSGMLKNLASAEAGATGSGAAE
jgi:peptidoglycan/xylan/chitin deacetylase (PgdA/CDA1 family)